MEARSIGSYLREMREAKKATLEDASRHTRVSLHFLQAIESDEFERLPAPAYAKGFLKAYADYLGADKEWVIQEYMKNHMAESKQILVLEGESLEPKNPWEMVKSVDRKIWIGIGAGVFILFIIFRLLFHTSVHSIMKDELGKDQGWKPSAQVIKPLAVETVVENAPQKQGEELILDAVAKDNVWMKVNADGKSVFEQILKKGDKQTWRAKSEFKVRTGNIENISFAFNGKPVKNINPTGKVLNIRFTEKGWWASD